MDPDLPPEPDGPPELPPETSPADAAGAPRRPGFVRSVFVNPQERRLRAFWRLLLHGLALVLAVLGVFVTAFVVAAVIDRFQPGAGSRTVNQLLVGRSDTTLAVVALVQAVLATGVTWLACRLLDRRPFGALGLRDRRLAAADLGFGFALSGTVIGGAFLAMRGFGWLRIEGFAWDTVGAGTVITSLARLGLTFVFVGWYEELVFRGYWLVNLREGRTCGWRCSFPLRSSPSATSATPTPRSSRRQPWSRPASSWPTPCSGRGSCGSRSAITSAGTSSKAPSSASR